MSSIIEQMREEALADVFKTKGFEDLWPERKSFLLSLTQNPLQPTKRDLIDLGQHLSAAFRMGKAKDRSNESLSQSGVTWESLVVWYLNLCLAGTHAVCVRGQTLSPTPIRDAMSVCFENNVLRSEPDVLIISCTKLVGVPQATNRREMLKLISKTVEEHFSSVGVVNLQCKTNWNDNAQIPMLWNMLYTQARKGALATDGFNIGRNGFSLTNLGYFGYGFVTVPTQTKGVDGFKPTNLEVMRVKTMSAGNYWGYASSKGVSSSLSEFFNLFSKNTAVFPNVADVAKEAAKAIQNNSSFVVNAKSLRFP